MNRYLITIVLALTWISHSLGAAALPEILPRPDKSQKPDTKKPAKVYFLSGQSNMCGMGKQDSLKLLATEDEAFAYLVDEDGNWSVRNDVHYIYYVMDKRQTDGPLTVDRRIGPELGIGHVLGHYHDEMVLLIKGACGNRSLGFDFLPPSSRKRQGKPMTGDGWYAGTSYDRYVKSAKNVLENIGDNLPGYKGQGYEMAGFFWWQGHKDRGMAKEQYEELLIELMNDFRSDFGADEDTPFVVATIAFNGNNLGPWQGVFDAQMAVGDPKQHPEFKGKVGSVDIRDIGGGGFHYGNNGATYARVGDRMGRAMAELLDEAAPARGAAATPSRKTVRAARRLAPGKLETLQSTLLGAVKGAINTGRWKPQPMPLSVARSKALLIAVGEDQTLTFQGENGKTADIPVDRMKAVDFVNLALVVALQYPDNKDAQALAGVYLEVVGRVEKADKLYARGGPEAKARMDAFFE